MPERAWLRGWLQSPAVLAIVLLALTALSAPVAAQTATWSGGTSTDWFNANNWTPGAVPTGSDAVVIDAITPNTTVLAGAAANAATVIIGDSGTGMLTLGAGGTLTAGSVTIASQVGSTGTLNIGADGLPGALNAATITFGAGTGTINFNHNDTGGYVFAPQISGSGAVVQNGTGTTILTGANTYQGGTVLNAGTLSVSADDNLGDPGGGLTFNGGTLQNTASFGTARTVTLNAGGGTFQTDADLTVSGDIGGVGSLTKTGAATLTLTGNNTYDGPTAIKAGTLLVASSTALSPLSAVTVSVGATLQIIDGGIFAGVGSLAGSGSVVIGNGSLLVVGLNDQSTTFSGAITGDGSFGKEGAGTLTLTGTSSIGGDLVVCCGTLDISGGAFTAAGLTEVVFGTLAVTNAGRLQTTDLLVSANLQISGAGSIVTVSRDTVIGAFDVAVATISNGGRLESQGDAFIGMSASMTVTGAGSTWAISGALVIGHPLGGPGTLTIADGGVVNAAAITVIDPSGTLNLGNGGLAGTIQTPLIVNDGQIVAAFTDTLSLSMPIEGAGALTKTGSGTLILTGVSTYSGPTTVDGGRLIVNGSITSAVTLATGTLLGGSGTVGGLLANAGSTVSPGNSIGTLTVAGTATFAAGSTYLVEIDSAGNADRIIASGTATLGGGTVRVERAGGVYTAGTRYTILTATGGVNGTFADFAQNGPLLTLALAYDANNVYLDISRNAVAFCDLASSRNQCAAGRGTESLGAGNPVYDAIVNLTDPNSIGRAFDLVSGEIHASGISTLVEESRYLRDAIIGRLRHGYGGAGPLAALSAPAGPVLALAGAPQAAASPSDAAATLFAQAPAGPANDTVVAAWTQAIGAWGKHRGDGNTATMSHSLGGFLIGVDATFDRAWRVGLAAGYSRTSFDVDARSSSGASDNYHLALYGGGRLGALGLRVGAGLTWHGIDTSRRVVFPGVADTVKADYNARTAQIFAEAGYGLTVDRTAFEPFAGLGYVNHHTGRINESGTVVALSGGRQSFDMAFSTLGLRAATTLTAGETAITLRGTLGWRHAFGDVTPEARLAFRSGGNPFTTAGVPIARDSLITEAGLDIDVTSYARFGFTYSGQFASRVYDHAVKGSLSLRF